MINELDPMSIKKRLEEIERRKEKHKTNYLTTKDRKPNLDRTCALLQLKCLSISFLFCIKKKVA